MTSPPKRNKRTAGTIRFDPRKFSRTFWKIRKAKARHVALYGGASASKSYSAYQDKIIRLLQEPRGDFIASRKTASTIRNSVYGGMKQIIHNWGLKDLFVFRYSGDVREIEVKTTGRKILFYGMDDTEKIKSVFNIKEILLEEANEYEFDDIKELNRRARGMPGIQLFYLFNPVLESHWLKVKLFDERIFKNFMDIHVTYRDNRNRAGDWFITTDDIEALEALKDHPSTENDYRIYNLGQWGKPRSGNEFFLDFNVRDHVDDVSFNRDLPVRLSIDQNVKPYVTTTVWQIEKVEGEDEEDPFFEVAQVDELLARDTRASAPSAGKMTVEYLNRMEYSGAVYVYGDTTTKSGNAIDELKRSFLDLYINQLKDAGFVVHTRFSSTNPPVMASGEFLNAVYRGAIESVEVVIGKHCKHSIEDYSVIKKDKDGGIYKPKVRDADGVAYEPHGHISDTKRYIICEEFKEEFMKYRRRFSEHKDHYFGTKGRMTT